MGLFASLNSGVRALTSSTDQEKWARLRAIIEADTNGDVDYLVRALTDPDWRRRAAKYLGRSGDERAVGPLIRLLGASDPHVRTSAANALGELRAVDAVNPLMGLARRDPEWWVRSWAVEALGKIGSEEPVPLLIAIADSEAEPWNLRAPAAVALGRIGDRRGLEAVQRVVRATPWWKRGAVRAAAKRLRRQERGDT